MRRFSKFRGIVSRIAAVVFCAATLVDCSGSAIPQRYLATSGVTCFANIAHASSLPLGAHVDCHGQAMDAYGRILIYVGGDTPWLAVDHGVAIDPSRPAASPDEIQSAQRDAALFHRGSTTHRIRIIRNDVPSGVAPSPTPTPTGSNTEGFGDGDLSTVVDTPQGKLREQLDGFYYDEHGGEWSYDAYDYINGLAPLWWIFSVPIPEGAVPLETK